MTEGIIVWILQSALIWVLLIGVALVISLRTNGVRRILVLAAAVIGYPIYLFCEPQVRAYIAKRDMAHEGEAFEAYCKGRRNNVFEKTVGGEPVIRIEPRAASYPDHVVLIRAFAGNLSDEARRRLCTQTNVKTIEGVELQKKVSFGICDKSHAPIAEWTSTHLIRFGPDTDVVENRYNHWRPFRKVQMQLVEVASGRVLAEDTVFRFSLASRKHKCPYMDDQIVEMILAVFDKSTFPPAAAPASVSRPGN